MTLDDEEERRLLAELLGGERAADDPAIAALLRRRPELRARLAALRELAEDLDASGFQGRLELAEAQSQVTGSDLELARGAIMKHSPTAPAASRPWWLIAAAAVLLAAIAAALWLQGGPASNGANPRLGPERDRGTVAPVQDGDWTSFHWSAAAVPAGGSLQLRIHAVRDGKTSLEPLAAVDGLTTAEGVWHLRAEEARLVGAVDEIRIELIALSLADGATTLVSRCVRRKR